jgi:iron complex transport system substrate-binding protein
MKNVRTIVNKPALFWLLLLPVCMGLPSRAAADTVVDQLARRIVVPDNPRRVISLAPSITEIVFTLKQENRLKGVTRYSDYPSQAKKLPRIGSYVAWISNASSP